MAETKITITADTQQAQAALEGLTRRLDAIEGSTKTASVAMNNMARTTGLATTAFTALAGAISIGKIVQLADAATLVNNKLTSVSESTAMAAKAFQQVTAIATKTGQPLEAVADLYQKISLQSKQLGLSQAETARITENFSKALVVTGTTGAAASSAIYQFGQSLGRGKVAYEDIRQLQESSSATVAMIAKQFNMSGQEFVAAVQAGKISSEQLALAVNALGDQVDPIFSKMNKTVSQAMENIRTSFIKVLYNFEQSTGVFAKLAAGLDFVAKNIHILVAAGTAMFAVFAVQRIMAIVTAIRAMGVAAAFASGGLTVIAGALAALAAYGANKFFGDKEVTNAEAVADASDKIRGANDARKRTEAEITKEQKLGLEAFLRKMDSQAKAASLSGQELAVQRAISAAAQELKITEEELSKTIRARVAAKAIEIYQDEQRKKNAEIILKAENERNKTYNDTLLQATNAAELARLTGLELEKEQAVRNANRALIKEIRNEQGQLLGFTKGMTAEEQKRLETQITAAHYARIETQQKQQLATAQAALNVLSIRDLDARAEALAVDNERIRLGRDLTREEEQRVRAIAQANQATREGLALERQRAAAAGQAAPATRAQRMEQSIGVIQRYNPALAQQARFAEEQAAAATIENEAVRNSTLERMRFEHGQRMHDIAKQDMEMQLRMAGVTNQGVIDAVRKSQDNIRLMQQGGVQAAMGTVDQLGYIFGQLGTYNKQAFQAAKAFNIASAIMNTYMGATKALASFPPPFNFVAAAAVVATGLAQVAAIRSQSFSGRQLGGPVMGGQTYLVGENGPELFTPTTTGSITPNRELGGGGDVVVNFNISTVDAAGFDRLLLQRRALITGIITDAQLEKGKRA